MTPIAITVIGMRNSTPHSTYIRRRIVTATLVTIALIAVSQILSKTIYDKYHYTCPTMSVRVVRGDTLSGITAKHCQGHTLQASWDIANERGTSALDTGDIVELGGK